MSINLNVTPYFDDFDEKKNFYQILFKPGFAVQSRELTQLQTILNKQIEKLGSHIFSYGSLVIPGNSFLDNNSDYVIVTKLGNTELNTFIAGQKLVGVTSRVEAIIRYAKDEGNNRKLYISYVKGGINGENVFANGEVIQNAVDTGFTCKAIDTNSTGKGTLFIIQEGIFYVNGFFVKSDSSIIEVDGTSQEASASIVFEIQESIVDYTQDETLLDPAQGSYNFAAQGADRLQIKLDLQVKSLDFTVDKNFILLMKVENGRIRFHSDAPKYSELEKSLAKRTYDESGNYVVNGLSFSVIEDKRTLASHGRSVDGDENKLCYNVDSGKAYIQGFEVRNFSQKQVIVDKARTLAHTDYVENINMRPEFGNYIYITSLSNIPNFSSHELIELYNSVSGGTKIGSAYAYDIDYVRGDIPSNTAIYKLYFRDITFTSANTFKNIGRITFSGGSAVVLHEVSYSRESGTTFTDGETVNGSSVNEVAVVHKQYFAEGLIYLKKTSNSTQVIPAIGSRIVGGSSTATAKVLSVTSKKSSGRNALLFKVPLQFVKSIRDKNNAPKIKYTVRKHGTIVTNSSGGGSLTITGGVIESLEQSNFIAATPAGTLDISLFTLNTPGTTITVTGGPANTTIKVYYELVKTNAIERTKTLTNRIQSGLTLTAGSVSLDRADIVEIVSITSSLLGDVTDRFILDNGQRDTHYQKGRITAVDSENYGNLTVEYKFYQHSVSGDYFTVDSYTSLGPNHYTKIGRYRSENDGIEYYLKDYFDFRKIVTDSANLIANGKLIAFDAQNFLPRIDTVVMNKEGNVVVKQGLPSNSPKAPEVKESEIGIAEVYLRPFTRNLKDIIVKEIAIKRFTMQDIKTLQNRVRNLEEYSLLSSLERSVINIDVVDAETGLNRYKSGYLVEDFSDFTKIAHFTNKNFKVLYEGRTLRPSQVVHQIPLVLSGGTNLVISGNSITLPYSLKKLVNQNISSRVVNLNPYLQTAWVGELRINPPTDSWVEVENLPDIIENRTETVTVTRVVRVPAPEPLVPDPPPWQPPLPEEPPVVQPPTPGEPPVVPPVVPPLPIDPPTVINPPVIVEQTVARPQEPQSPQPPVFDGGDGGLSSAGLGDGIGDGGGGGGGGGKIICTKLYELGLLPQAIYEVDQQFGQLLLQKDPDILHGYHYWANMVVEWMSGKGIKVLPLSDEKFYPLAEKWSISWAQKIATPWAEHMAFEMGLLKEDNKLGRLLMGIGKPLSKLFSNKYKTNKKPGLITAYFSILVFAVLYLIVKVYPKEKK